MCLVSGVCPEKWPEQRWKRAPLGACWHVTSSSGKCMQTASKLYLVLDFVNGGHLFFQLYRQGIFDEDLARLYTAEMVLAITHLHSLGIAHRDLKPVRGDVAVVALPSCMHLKKL